MVCNWTNLQKLRLNQLGIGKIKAAKAFLSEWELREEMFQGGCVFSYKLLSRKKRGVVCVKRAR